MRCSIYMQLKMVLNEISNVMAACKVEVVDGGSCAHNVAQANAVADGACAPPNTPKFQLVRQITPKPFVRPLTWAPVKKPPPHDPRPIPENSTAKRAIKFD